MQNQFAYGELCFLGSFRFFKVGAKYICASLRIISSIQYAVTNPACPRHRINPVFATVLLQIWRCVILWHHNCDKKVQRVSCNKGTLSKEVHVWKTKRQLNKS